MSLTPVDDCVAAWPVNYQRALDIQKIARIQQLVTSSIGLCLGTFVTYKVCTNSKLSLAYIILSLQMTCESALLIEASMEMEGNFVILDNGRVNVVRNCLSFMVYMGYFSEYFIALKYLKSAMKLYYPNIVKYIRAFQYLNISVLCCLQLGYQVIITNQINI